MSLRVWVVAPVFVVSLAAQTSSQQSSTWRIDANGQRIEGSQYTVVESPSGSQKVETQRSINGRMVPLQSSEDRVLQQDSSTKIVERTIRTFDANGNPGPPTKVRIEERKNPDGSSTIQSTAYRTDINGNSQLAERAVTQIRKGAATETTTVIERPTLNGSMQAVERSNTVERPSGSGSQIQSTTFRPNISGSFAPVSQEVKQITKSGVEETTDAAHYEIGSDGKMTLTSRAIDRVKTNADGSQSASTDVYSRFSAGKTGDVNASEPRLQEQIQRERKPAPGGKTIETTSVRSRLPNDPSRFGAYEQVSQTVYTSTDPAGREVKRTETNVGRRDPNGQIVAQEGSAGVSTKK